MKNNKDVKVKMLTRLKETVQECGPADLSKYVHRFLGTPEAMEVIDKEGGHEITDDELKIKTLGKKRKNDFI